LQRAFEVSGARSVIGTYWNVQDDEAILFSTTFFEAFWKNKKTKLAALQEAQLKLMNRPGDATNPRSWAAWSLSGHIGNSE
jgi:CHAT domain-containing protein